MTAEFLSPILERIHSSTQFAQQHFAALTSSQLNWKADSSRWSIGQCLDHLITTNELYFNKIDQVASGSYSSNFWEKAGFLSGFIGRKMVDMLGPTVTRKAKSPANFQPSASEIPSDIVMRFVDHQSVLKQKLQQLESQELEKLIISSPAATFVTYSLADAIRIIAGHEERHLNQALHVKESEGFPTATAK